MQLTFNLNLNFFNLRLNIVGLIVLTFLFSFFSLFSVKNASSATFNISGKITNSVGDAIADAKVDIVDVNTNTSLASIISDSLGNYALSIDEGTYNIQVTPPAGSNFSPAIAAARTISSNTIINFILTSAGTVSLSEHVYDRFGNPLHNQIVKLGASGAGTVAQANTDASGSYYLEVSQGTYQLIVQGGEPAQNVPQEYTLFANYSLTQSTVLDINIPTKKVDVHVQDTLGNPVSGTLLKVSNNGTLITDFTIGGNVTVQNAISRYLTGVETDSSGNATLWLLPNASGTSPYSIIATPPNTSLYQQSILSNISVITDQTEIISLQYSHNPPITTSILETQHTDGTYSNPTTVTLSATADTGYTVANTYYEVNGGSQQTYSSPFSVSEMGDHHIEYWSVDNSGVQEGHKTKDFTIYTNQASYINPISDTSINLGQVYDATGSFIDPDSTSWTATVDYDEGVGPESLTLNPDKTFNLSHQYEASGIYTVTVVVTDGQQATGTTMTTITVNAPPQITGLSDTEINYQDDFIQSGSFIGPDSTSWTGTVDYGDSSGVQNLTLDENNFMFNHTYFATGVYTVTVNITDNQGATDTEEITVIVNGPLHISQLLGATITEGQMYTENGSFTDPDSSSWTATVDYDGGQGVQPLTLTGNTFSLSNLYEQNGTYTVGVTITDNQGATETETTTVTVNNDNPQVGTITASVNPIQVNTPVTFSASFTDQGILDTHTAIWNFGDGTTSSGTVTESDGSGSVSDSHTYTQAGVYELTLTVTDNNNASDQEVFQYFSVYNPTPQGLFSGARIFQSPAGSYPVNQNLSGQVQFGITAKYQNGIPVGNVSMKFNAANIEFEATLITVLVTSNGKATLRGTGTINSIGNYTFLTTGIDGANDTIRFQIKDSSNNIVYGSQINQADTVDPTAYVTGQVIVH